jgi:hypothetical protein
VLVVVFHGGLCVWCLQCNAMRGVQVPGLDLGLWGTLRQKCM